MEEKEIYNNDGNLNLLGEFGEETEKLVYVRDLDERMYSGIVRVLKTIEKRLDIIEKTLKDQIKYPCEDCGALRTKAEGGTTFTVCDDCWDKKYKD